MVATVSAVMVRISSGDSAGVGSADDPQAMSSKSKNEQHTMSTWRMVSPPHQNGISFV